MRLGEIGKDIVGSEQVETAQDQPNHFAAGVEDRRSHDQSRLARIVGRQIGFRDIGVLGGEGSLVKLARRDVPATPAGFKGALGNQFAFEGDQEQPIVKVAMQGCLPIEEGLSDISILEGYRRHGRRHVNEPAVHQIELRVDAFSHSGDRNERMVHHGHLALLLEVGQGNEGRQNKEQDKYRRYGQGHFGPHAQGLVKPEEASIH